MNHNVFANFLRNFPSSGLCRIFASVVVLVGFSYTLAVAQPYGLNDRVNLSPFLNGVLPSASPLVTGSWSAVPAFPNLIFTNALGLTFIPGTNQLCVWEREGRVWSFINNSNVTQKKLVLDISVQCQGWDDSGLLGLAFHPGFATNHFMFVYYVWVIPGTVQGSPTTRPPTFMSGAYHDRLVRYTLDTNGVALPGSELILVDQPGDSVWHNGGGMFFHPTNGFLYWTDGDDATGSKTQIITNNLFSGAFRVDVDMRGGAISHPIPRQPANGATANYFIPNDNPFVGQTNVLEEFFCLGLRSPHRMTLDPPTGRIFIGDVGESQREEIDVIESGESGLNFQWNRIEGLGGDLTPPFVGINRRPVLDYTHSEGIAVIGGYVYRGSEFASDLGGKYIFGDNGARTVWVMDESTVPAGKVALCTVPQGTGPNSGNDYTGLSSFGVDEAGEIYMCQMTSIGGYIYKLSRTGPTNTLNPPPLFSQLGAFTNLATLAPAAWLVPYTVNSPLWSDAAYKSRWIALPTNTFIKFYPTGEWSFPSGTVFFKNFELATNESFPTLRRRLETRLLVCDTNGTAYGATYKWRPDNSEADLLTFSTNENILITTATGVRTQVWSYPGRQECLRCHTTAAGSVLGAKTRQLNGDLSYPTGVTDNQLRTWNHLGFFATALNEAAITNLLKSVSVSDTNATLELRARSYFDANCAHCHRPGGVNALFDMRLDTPLASQGLVNRAALNSLGLTGAKIVKPGDTNNSVLFQRDNSLGLIQMPPLAKNLVDTNAMAVIAAWITALPLPTNNLPLPWQDADLGNALPGNGSATNGQFSLTASGDDIWNNADAGNFIYQPINGDGQIIAHVTDVQITDSWAKSGVMFRESLAAGARHVFLALTPANGVTFQYRTTPGDVCSYNSTPSLTAPYWVKLVRANNVFTGYSSANGTNWTLVGSVSNAMSSAVQFGLAATAHNAATYNLSTADNVSLVFANGQPLYATASALIAPADGAHQIVQFTAQAFAGAGAANADTTDDHTGTITAQGENIIGGEVAANAFDENTATKWLDFATNYPATRASWIQYRYAGVAQCVVTQYTLTSANDAPERDPKNWRLQGSNDGGTNWFTLDTRVGETFANRFQTRSFTATNTSAYNLYRLQIDSVNEPTTAVAMQLAELEFLGPTYTYAWSFGDGATSAEQNPSHSYTTNGTYNARVIISDGAAFITNTLTVNVLLTPAAIPQWLSTTATVTNHTFSIEIQGTDGANYIVEATTNFTTWTPVLTNAPVGGFLQFTDPQMTNQPYRFYRVRTP